MVTAGKLRQRISIQRRDAGQDAIGQPVDTWTEVRSCWADIRHTSGVEAGKADTLTSAARASIRIRWTDAASPDMRVVIGSTVYAIKGVLPDLARREFVDLVCESVR